MLRLVGAVVLGMTALGLPLGLLWVLSAPATPVVKTAQGAFYTDPQPEQPIAADGWFSLLALGFGLVAAVLLWFLLKSLRGPAGLVALALGGLGATLVAWQLGIRIGRSTYERLLVEAAPGQYFEKPVELRAGGVELVGGVLPVVHGSLLLAAFGSAVAYTLLAGWSRWPSLHPEPDPYLDHLPAGYGPHPGVDPAGHGPQQGPDQGGGSTGPGPEHDAGRPGVSWDPRGNPAPPAAPEPPAPDAAGPPRG
jgi:hypothetical protein